MGTMYGISIYSIYLHVGLIFIPYMDPMGKRQTLYNRPPFLFGRPKACSVTLLNGQVFTVTWCFWNRTTLCMKTKNKMYHLDLGIK